MITKKDPIVERKIGKKYLHMRMSHRLPFYYGEFPFYNRALSRICKKIFLIDGYLIVIDIGANIGDTVSLITDEVNGSFLCIEGDKEYLPLLKMNLSKIKDSKILIEESYCTAPELVDSNYKFERRNGTAKLILTGNRNMTLQAQFKTLDDIISQYPYFIDANIVKIDTDGFEINVLKGGEKYLLEKSPILFIEFAPELYLDNSQDPMFVFEFLYRSGYNQALIYNNFGIPFEIINTSDENAIKRLLKLVDKKNIYYYDILACHFSKITKYTVIFKTELKFA